MSYWIKSVNFEVDTFAPDTGFVGKATSVWVNAQNGEKLTLISEDQDTIKKWKAQIEKQMKFLNSETSCLTDEPNYMVESLDGFKS